MADSSGTLTEQMILQVMTDLNRPDGCSRKDIAAGLIRTYQFKFEPFGDNLGIMLSKMKNEGSILQPEGVLLYKLPARRTARRPRTRSQGRGASASSTSQG
ncbi:hypothetical protein ACET3Z_000105 [Daucus carota]